MSIESAKSFIGRMKVDQEFANNVMSCKDGQTRMAFIKEAGFAFTLKELQDYEETLTEEELNMVAGGSGGGDSDILNAGQIAAPFIPGGSVLSGK